MKIYPIYKNGRVRLIPHVTLLRIEVDGKVLPGTYDPRDVETAISDVDRMAEEFGEFAHVA